MKSPDAKDGRMSRGLAVCTQGAMLQENAAAPNRGSRASRSDQVRSEPISRRRHRRWAANFVDAVGGAGAWKVRPDHERQVLRDNAWIIKGMEEEQRRRLSCRELGSLNMPVLLIGGEKSPARYGEILAVIEPCLKQGERVTALEGCRKTTAIGAQEPVSQGGGYDHCAAALHGFAREISTVNGIFPNSQPRTRGSPSLDHFGIGPRLLCDPFDKVQHQTVETVGHR
jgi:hypothetical protein